MRAMLFTLMSLSCTLALAATVYKWVDDEGVVHYSDQPHENAQKVELKAPQTYSAPRVAPGTQASGPGKSGPVYQSCSLTSPTADQAYVNVDSISASVAIVPPVRPGDKVVVTLDGQRVPGVPPEGGSFGISPIERGTHALQLYVQDPMGKNVCQSSSVTFYVRQPSSVSSGGSTAPGVPTVPGAPTVPGVPTAPRPR